MFSFCPELIYPFVYLDSSSILRTSATDFKFLTRKIAVKRPNAFQKSLENIHDLAQADAAYYRQLIALQQHSVISKLITFETVNEFVQLHIPNQITLFGKVQNWDIHSFQCKNKARLDDVILWEETVNIKLYNQAALSLVDANCVVTDADFLKVAVGQSLTKYITEPCKMIILSTKADRFSINTDFTVCKLSPKAFIQLLFDATN